MAEIILDDNKLCIPTRLKIATFLSEFQKKTKQIIYLINDKEIGIFGSLNDVKRGMWRRLKPNDSIAYYYIDPETQNEYTIFSSECANKLGNFPYEGPDIRNSSVNTVQSQDRSAYQQSVQTMRPPIRSLTPSSSLQAPIQSVPPPMAQQISYQPPTVQNQFMNVGYQKYPIEQRPQPDPQQKMNSKSIQNMNRIMAFQKQQMAPPEPTMNQWFNNDMDHSMRFNPQEMYPSSQSYSSFQNINPSTYPQQNINPSTYPQQNIIQSSYPQQNINPTTYPQQQNINPTSYPNPQQNVQQSTQSYNVNRQSSLLKQSTVPSAIHSVVVPSVTNRTVSSTSDSDFRDPMKYFPPGTRKNPNTNGGTENGTKIRDPVRQQNVIPQTVESKFSA